MSDLNEITVEIDNDGIHFSNGKFVEANCGIVGLSRGAEFLSGGYDDGIKTEAFYDDDDDYLKPDEQIALANYMISQWVKFRDSRKQ